MATKVGEVKSLKVGKFVVIDGEPCKVVSMQTAKTGKHGHAKARVEGIGILDGQKRTLVSPVDAKVDLPITEKKSAQIIAFLGDRVQLMDMEDYNTYELPMPGKEEIEGTMVEGAQVEVLNVMGRKKITRVR
ncbi:MAG: translation initiation factor IF-5A [Candidatus Hydrothermarchaeaceae archaeon]|jgi:translation initiation factor 5A